MKLSALTTYDFFADEVDNIELQFLFHTTSPVKDVDELKAVGVEDTGFQFEDDANAEMCVKVSTRLELIPFMCWIRERFVEVVDNDGICTYVLA